MRTVTSVRVIGSREGQEDRYYMNPIRMHDIEGYLLAVFDGHNGEETAQYCRAHFANYFQPRNAVDVPDALSRAIVRLSQKTRAFESGSTLSAVCVLEDLEGHHDIAVVAVLGDSPVIVRREDGSVWTSTLHNVGTNEEERREAIANGAYFGFGYISMTLSGPGLQLSRALGDAPFRSILSDTPEISVIESPAAVLVASDGIFNETYSDKDTMQELGKQLAEFEDANAVLNWRMHLGEKLRDNTTVLLWKR